MLQERRFHVDTTMLSPLAREVRDSGLTYLSPAKLQSLEAALARVQRNNVPGDFLELGVALGGSAVVIASQCPPGHAFHGYDVFDMIPPPGEQDDERAHSRYQEMRSGRSKGRGRGTYDGYLDDLYDQVCRLFGECEMAVDGARINLHKGLFQDMLDASDPVPVAFAHIDCDWYESVRYCLDALRRRLAPGAVVVLDDYRDYGGCRKAVDAFLTDDARMRVLKLEPHAVLERM